MDVFQGEQYKGWRLNAMGCLLLAIILTTTLFKQQ